MTSHKFTSLLSAIVDNRGRSCPVVDVGFPLIATNCVKPDQLYPTFENVRYVDEKTYTNWFRGHPEPNDILFVCKGSPGRVALVPDPVSFCIAQDMVSLRADSNVIHYRYLYYLLASQETQRKIENLHVGTMIPHFKKGDFGKLHLSIHESIVEQLAIAEVLGALDDKIAANRKLAETADDWIRSRYLSLTRRVEDSTAVSDLVKQVRVGADPSELCGFKTYVGLEHIPRRLLWMTDSESASAVTSVKSRFSAGDILFGRLRPYFHKVVSAPVDGVCSTDVLVLQAKNQIFSGWAMAALSSDYVIERATSASEGTRMPRAKWADISAIELPWPGTMVAEKFSGESMALRSAVVSGIDESRNLVAVRDALLPQLMSGKLRVRDAEKQVEAVL